MEVGGCRGWGGDADEGRKGERGKGVGRGGWGVYNLNVNIYSF